jgi:hypothetical protein
MAWRARASAQFETEGRSKGIRIVPGRPDPGGPEIGFRGRVVRFPGGASQSRRDAAFREEPLRAHRAISRCSCDSCNDPGRVVDRAVWSLADRGRPATTTLSPILPRARPGPDSDRVCTPGNHFLEPTWCNILPGAPALKSGGTDVDARLGARFVSASCGLAWSGVTGTLCHLRGERSSPDEWISGEAKRVESGENP